MYKIFLTIGKIGVDLTPWVILLEFDLSKTLDITLDNSYRDLFNLDWSTNSNGGYLITQWCINLFDLCVIRKYID